MRNAIILCSIVLILWSCNDSKKGQNGAVIVQDTSFLPINYDYTKAEGIYSGDFGGSDIHVSLRHINGRHAMGYSIHKGMKRNFTGNIKPEGAGFRFTLSEPGNNEYDGIFDFVLDTTTFSIKGSWTPNDTKTLTTKNYTLTKLADSLMPFYHFSDSIGGFIFERDGVCSYETYSRDDAKPQAPIAGTWTKKGDMVTIDWQPNTVFPSKTGTYKIEEGSLDDNADYPGISFIAIDGRKLYTAEGQ